MCRRCAPSLEGAKRYLEKYASDAWWYEKIALGYLSLADPTNFGKFRQNAIAAAAEAKAGDRSRAGSSDKEIPREASNHRVALSALFLSECVKRGLAKPSLLEPLLREAARGQLDTGGWSHYPGFASPGYAVDLAIITAPMFAALMNLKAGGYRIPDSVAAMAQWNLNALSVETGLAYGTRNPAPDRAGSRAAYAFLGLSELPGRDDRLLEHLRNTIPTRFEHTGEGHGVASLHFLPVAMAAHVMGPDVYERFASHWVDRLINLQEPDGAVWLPDDGAGGGEPKHIGRPVASTAVFCLILLLQNPEGAFATPRMRQAWREAAKKKHQRGEKRNP